MFWLTVLHEIFYRLCVCLQNIIEIVRLLLAAVGINGLRKIALAKCHLEIQWNLLIWANSWIETKIQSMKCKHILSGIYVISPSASNTRTLMLLVANFVCFKIMQNTLKMDGTLAYGYSSESTHREPSNEYSMTGLRWFSILHPCF